MATPKEVIDALSGGLVQAGSDAWTPIIDGIVAVRRWLGDRHNWVRVAWFGSGVVLMFLGAEMVARPVIDQAAAPAAKLAGKVL